MRVFFNLCKYGYSLVEMIVATDLAISLDKTPPFCAGETPDLPTLDTGKGLTLREFRFEKQF